MADSYVCSKARIKCSCGDKISTLTVFPDRTVWLTGQPQANISDHTPLKNIAPFGKCHTTAYPPTGAATAAHHGHLTPMPCVPNTPFPWMNGKNDVLIKGQPALLKSSSCRCIYGGTITITFDGQTDTGSPDMSKLAIETEEQWNQEQLDQEQLDQLTPEDILDGLQLALDAAGFFPGVGAIPDLLNAAISAMRGNWMEAGMSVLAAVPVIGDAAAGAKLAGKGLKVAKAIPKTRMVALSKEAKKYISTQVDAKKLLKSGICKNDKEVEFLKGAVRAERKEYASHFYKTHGVTNKGKIASHVNGIDLNKPVSVKKMPPPYKMQRYEDPSQITKGSYYGFPKAEGDLPKTPRQYGIQPVVDRKIKNAAGDDEIIRIRKKKINYSIDDNAPSFEYLESTAAPIKAPLDNNWNGPKNPGNWKPTKGGAVQAYVPYEYQKYINILN